MKKILFYVLVASIFVSCQNTGNNEELEKLKAENARLQGEAYSRDSTINDYLMSFNQIQENLAVIREKENIITINAKSGNELQQDDRDKINNDIQLINELMEKNKKKIASLRKKIKNADLKIAEFEKMIAMLNEQLADKDKEIAGLKEQLLALNFTIDKLNAKVDTLIEESEVKTEVINKQTDELNTAYYVIGTYKELKEHKILSKSGGFIGIGKTEKVQQDFDQNYFTKIDIRKSTEFPLNAKKAELVTAHPSDSYKLDTKDKKVVKITITNPDKFWKASKYLVIKVD